MMNPHWPYASIFRTVGVSAVVAIWLHRSCIVIASEAISMSTLCLPLMEIASLRSQ